MSGWPEVTLGEVGKISTGSTPATSDPNNFGGLIPFVTPSELGDFQPIESTPRTLTEQGAAKARLVPKDAVMVCCIGSLGKIGISGRPLATNQQINSIVFDTRRVLPRFGLRAVARLSHQMERMAPATTVPIISKSKFQGLTIPLPPLDEQRRIAAILDQADALRRKRREARARVGRMKLSLLDDFIASTDRLKKVRLSEVAKKITDGTHQAPVWSSSGIPFIFVSNVRNGSISLETEKFVSNETYEQLTRYAPIEIGDVLYTAVGSYGHAAVVQTDEKFLFQRHVAHIKPDLSKLHPEFLAPLLESPKLRRQADRVAKGVAQKTVTLAELKAFEIDLPALEDQNLFVARARKIDEMGWANDQHLAQLDALFASLQHRAFRGEL